MIINYDIIKHNIEIYNSAKCSLPIIGEYERGEVNYSHLRNLGVYDFADFYNFIKEQNQLGFSLIMENMTWRKLKPILISNTKNERFKKLISNKTQRQFNDLFQDIESLDRLLNGRWLSKPHNRGKKGRKYWGRRSNERCEGLDCIIPIINYLIQNEIDVVTTTDNYDLYSSFFHQDRWSNKLKWFHYSKLDESKVPKREIEISRNLISNLNNFIIESKIDFRKVNYDFITSIFSNKVKELISIPKGTMIKCIKDKPGELTKDKSYCVDSCDISNGYLRVYVLGENKKFNWIEYSYFEDMSIHRNSLLDNLFDT